MLTGFLAHLANERRLSPYTVLNYRRDVLALFELAGGVPERIRSFGARFTSPVYPGETLQVELWHSGHVRVRVVERDIIALNHGHVTIGEAA